MKYVAAAICFVMLTSLFAQQDKRTAKIRGGWSSQTVSLFNTWGGLDSNPDRKLTFYSPDKKKRVHVVGESVEIFVGSKRFHTDFQNKTNAELGWAPDSSRFFLTWTDGGETGSWHTQVYDLSENGIVEIKGLEGGPRKDFEAKIRNLPRPRNLKKRYWDQEEYCEANVVGSEWLSSSELLVSVLVPNVGDCRYMSEFNVYRIAIPTGEILQSYTAKEAHRRFNSKNLPIIAR